MEHRKHGHLAGLAATVFAATLAIAQTPGSGARPAPPDGSSDSMGSGTRGTDSGPLDTERRRQGTGTRNDDDTSGKGRGVGGTGGPIPNPGPGMGGSGEGGTGAGPSGSESER